MKVTNDLFKDHDQILNLIDKYAQNHTYGHFMVVGILQEMIDQHHKAVDAYTKANQIDHTLFARLSIARAHAKISHWSKATQLFCAFTDEEFGKIVQTYHKGLVAAYLPYHLQQTIYEKFKGASLSKADQVFGMLSEGRVAEINDSLLLEVSTHFQVIATLLLGRSINVDEKRILVNYGISDNYLELIENKTRGIVRSIHSWITTKVHILKHTPLSKLDLLDGWLTQLEGRVLFILARITPQNQDIVEIGAWKGKSSSFLAEGSALGNCAMVYSVDPHQWSDDIQVENTYSGWLHLMEQLGYSNVISNIRKFSKQALENVADNIGLLFIDGEHSVEGVRTDILHWCPKVVEGGFVIFHDSFFESIFVVLEELIWLKDDYRIIDVIEGMLIVQKQSSSKRKRSQTEVALWIYLEFRKNSIKSFLLETHNELGSSLLEQIDKIDHLGE